jgi:hypothetical protein
MKKSRRKSRTGNPAKQRRGNGPPHDGPPPDGQHGKRRWIGREVNAFLGLRDGLAEFILLVALAAVVALWRWLTGSAPN